MDARRLIHAKRRSMAWESSLNDVEWDLWSNCALLLHGPQSEELSLWDIIVSVSLGEL